VFRDLLGLFFKFDSYGHSDGRFDDPSVNEWRRHETRFYVPLK